MSTEREIMITPTPEYEAEPAAVTDDLEKMVALPVNLIQRMATELIDEVKNGDTLPARLELQQLFDKYFSLEEHIGTSADFHNLAVELSRSEEYALACGVLECGLKLFPKNVDLLADYLQYGVNCPRQAECKKYYKLLLKIPRRRWTWRGFSFTVDYLKMIIDSTDSDKEIDACKEMILQIARDYRRFFPHSEGSYRSEASVYAQLNMPEEEEEVLREALEKLRIVPGCALRYADILFERGDYKEAADAIQRALNSIKARSVVSEGYLHYLSGLCKVAISQQAGDRIDRETAEDVYAAFNLAAKHFGSTKNSFTEMIKTQTWATVQHSRIEVDPQAYEDLYALITV